VPDAIPVLLPEGVQVGQVVPLPEGTLVMIGTPPPEGWQLSQDAIPVLPHEGAQDEQTGPLTEGTTVRTGMRLPPEATGVAEEHPASQTAVGGIGVPGGGVRSRQWKIVVRNALSRPSVGGSPTMGALTARMVIISWVSSASTCQTLLPLSSTHHLTTRHLWAGLPASWTVMMRPVGSSAGRGEDGTADWLQAMPVDTRVAMTALIHRDRTMRLVSFERSRRSLGGTLSPGGASSIFIDNTESMDQSEYTENAGYDTPSRCPAPMAFLGIHEMGLVSATQHVGGTLVRAEGFGQEGRVAHDPAQSRGDGKSKCRRAGHLRARRSATRCWARSNEFGHLVAVVEEIDRTALVVGQRGCRVDAKDVIQGGQHILRRVRPSLRIVAAGVGGPAAKRGRS